MREKLLHVLRQPDQGRPRDGRGLRRRDLRQDCGIGGDCLVDSDCVTGKCDTGNSQCRVFTTTELCGNGVLHHEETDVDCRGPMCSWIGKLCPVAKLCAADSNCRSGTCDQAYATAVAGGNALCVSCSDGAKNGDESDVDCGGAKCDR